MNTLSDEALMLKVKSGQIQTLGLLYERHKKRLFGFFFQMHKNASLSEDMVQNVFVRVLKYKHTYTDDSKFLGWLFKIARNVSYDHFKAQNMHHDLDAVSYKLSDEKTIADDLDVTETKTLLHQAIQHLSPEKRELIVLNKIKELKYKQVAEIVNSTEGAVRTKVHRILQELKHIYLQLDKR